MRLAPTTLSPSARRGRAAALALALAAPVALASAPAAAQQQPTPNVPVEGWVVDSLNGWPIVGAEVWVQGSAPVYTDENGFFSLGTMPAGEHVLRVRNLTHTPREFAAPFGEGHPRPRIALEPDSARADQLRETVGMMARERRRGGQYFRVIERDELLTLSGEELHSRARTFLPFGGRCERSPNTGACIGSTGPLIVLDDDIAGAPLRRIESLDPRSLFVVELYPDRRLAHAYTLDFIARAMESPALLLRARRTPR